MSSFAGPLAAHSHGGVKLSCSWVFRPSRTFPGGIWWGSGSGLFSPRKDWAARQICPSGPRQSWRIPSSEGIRGWAPAAWQCCRRRGRAAFLLGRTLAAVVPATYSWTPRRISWVCARTGPFSGFHTPSQKLAYTRCAWWPWRVGGLFVSHTAQGRVSPSAEYIGPSLYWCGRHFGRIWLSCPAGFRTARAPGLRSAGTGIISQTCWRRCSFSSSSSIYLRAGGQGPAERCTGPRRGPDCGTPAWKPLFPPCRSSGELTGSVLRPLTNCSRSSSRGLESGFPGTGSAWKSRRIPWPGPFSGGFDRP